MLAERNAALNHELLIRIQGARDLSDTLLRIVKPSAIFERPIAERHRIIFYLGHLEAFDWNLLRERVLGCKSVHPEFDRLFAFGIDPVGGGLPNDQPSDWPTVAQVNEYVAGVRDILDDKLTSVLDSRTKLEGPNTVETLLNVAIEHRLMHVETLSYMLHQLPYETKIGKPRPPESCNRAVQKQMLEIPAGSATLGLSRGSDVFGWDNEFKRHTVSVPAFEIDPCMITNGDYLKFIDSGGYGSSSFWTEQDWNWKSEQNISHPVFWKKSGDRWFYLSMFGEFPLPLDWPVYVSHAEASAYARWAGKLLPTEEEWHRAAYGTRTDDERSYPWGSAPLSPALCNADFASWDPLPVNAFPQSQSAFGVQGLIGNGWEWTATQFAPFAGFEPFPFYPGYSANFFDGRHFVMKGGSPRTAACMLRPTFRNWFQPHYQYVYAGFRCVRR